ncbi:glycerol-3-phosphate 1-O-acyltransferase PlsY [Fusibacillus kribbianus]|uniref:Glycerol-3-phosphate acyltransferase n=1 Tax=Fusibacillus kribbianus TaxID=3044208 RepID=A0AAP4EZ97_9FIRM|nr:glycerol-3-phosphate 1-O-acyltransferase PlsY [Ruminococcus sp. YH-rum2234]MDI9241660.1 glycerol-3-phosphate 1-O-acyltransferase PlsY [Ruminococcus sp. YH-rum2234]
MERIICLLTGYVFGLIQTGYIYGKIIHKDIRQYGSGNSGTTNALRVLGKKAGVIVFLGDFLKAVILCLLVKFLYGKTMPEMAPLLMLYGGLGVVLGHNYPFYLKFKGGKGIAATSGVIITMDWRITLVCLAAFVISVAITRIVSIGSLLVVTVFLGMWIGLGLAGLLPLSGPYLTESFVVVLVFTALAYWRHRANIKRLINGTENRFGSKNK